MTPYLMSGDTTLVRYIFTSIFIKKKNKKKKLEIIKPFRGI